MYAHLDSHRLWHYFKAISQVPRPSKKEEEIRLFMREFAQRENLSFEEDAIGNLVIHKPASPGQEKRPTVILQGHLDMVCQKKPESEHNFLTDPIELIEEEGWLRANLTTLGADNGIGVAAGLAILEDKTLTHGPLKLLLTVDEEAGMGGVRNLNLSTLKGDYLLNLDSEEFGAAFVGCAGGCDIILEKDLYDYYSKEEQGLFYQVTVNGLKGGHSGLDIDKGYGNANQILAEFLTELAHDSALKLHTFKGGDARNALTREAEAIILLSSPLDQLLKEKAATWQRALKEKYQPIDDGVMLTYKPLTDESLEELGKGALDAQLSTTILEILTLLPHGVIHYSPTLSAVETSCNIGTITLTKDTGLEVALLARSLNNFGLNEVKRRAESLAYLGGLFIDFVDEYPPWTPKNDSYLLKTLQKLFEKNFNQPLRVQVMHAGLETGLIGKHLPNLEMISFGPDIERAHSPEERVNIKSVDAFYTLLKDYLNALADSPNL